MVLALVWQPTKYRSIKTLWGDAWLLMAVQAVIVKKCQSQQTRVTSQRDGGGLVEFRGGTQSASNLTSHTPSRFYQGSC